MWNYMLLWITVSVLALVIDIMTSSFLFIWFSIGGIISMFLTLSNYSFSIQLISFIVTSLILMATGYPFIKKTIKKTVPETLTMEENYIGREFISIKDIEKKAIIKYEGIYWTAKNTGEYINMGDKVKIVGIEGNKLLVKKDN